MDHIRHRCNSLLNLLRQLERSTHVPERAADIRPAGRDDGCARSGQQNLASKKYGGKPINPPAQPKPGDDAKLPELTMRVPNAVYRAIRVSWRRFHLVSTGRITATSGSCH